MLDAAAGPSRAHRLRLLRAGDDPLRARELQGFRFRAAARPGAACSYAMQDQALGGRLLRGNQDARTYCLTGECYRIIDSLPHHSCSRCLSARRLGIELPFTFVTCLFAVVEPVELWATRRTHAPSTGTARYDATSIPRVVCRDGSRAEMAGRRVAATLSPSALATEKVQSRSPPGAQFRRLPRPSRQGSRRC